jgi:hypothetical protein
MTETPEKRVAEFVKKRGEAGVGCLFYFFCFLLVINQLSCYLSMMKPERSCDGQESGLPQIIQ